MPHIYNKSNRNRATVKGQRKTKKYRKRTSVVGGDVIGSGGFGCVFRPALKCKRKTKRKDHSVSKLLTRRHAKKEYDIIKRIRTKLRDIPHYSEYFLIDGVSTCALAPLSESDLSNFDEKCKVMKKYDNITSKNVNDNLAKLRSIELPDGGISLVAYYANMKDMGDFQFIHDQLTNLLTHAVVPMNDRHVYHADIKESNILFNLHTQKIGLIDWGLSFYTKGGRIPKIIKNKPLQYNLPFSVVLFNKTFDAMYSTFTRTHKSPTMRDLTVFVEDYLDAWIDKRGAGHMGVMDDIWKAVSDDDDVDVLRVIVVPYLADILYNYTTNGRFHKTAYFNETFLPNLDIWGLLMSYSTVLEHNTFARQSALANIYIEFLLSTASSPINVNNLVSRLKYI